MKPLHGLKPRISAQKGDAVQAALRWLIQQNNVSAIPKSGDSDHQKENFDIFDFQLTQKDMEKIFELQGKILK